MIKSRFPFVALVALALLCGSTAYVEAERFGGENAFGNQPLCERKAPASPIPRRENARAGTLARTGTLPERLVGPTRPLGGGRGLFGGLLMGGMIGSYLFRDDQSDTGPGLLDILVLGGGLLLICRRLAARRTGSRSLRRLAFGARSVGGGSVRAPVPAESIPQDFDEVEFLAGAKAAYRRLLSSWDSRDLEDIRQFTTPDVWEVIRRQAEANPTPGRTEILSLNAGLLDLKRNGEYTVAVVLFDVRLRERRKTCPALSIHEIWHFSRKESAPDSFWRLKDIQQVMGEIPA